MTPAVAGADTLLIERFLEMLAAEAGAARNTLLAYRTDLRAASALLGGGLAEADGAAINRLATDAGSRTRFAQAGRQRVIDHFSWTAIAERTAALYRRVIAEATAGVTPMS